MTTSDAVATYVNSAAINLTATDAGSGVAATYYKLDGGAQAAGTADHRADARLAHPRVLVGRRAGNVETPHKTATFTITAPRHRRRWSTASTTRRTAATSTPPPRTSATAWPSTSMRPTRYDGVAYRIDTDADTPRSDRFYNRRTAATSTPRPAPSSDSRHRRRYDSSTSYDGRAYNVALDRRPSNQPSTASTTRATAATSTPSSLAEKCQGAASRRPTPTRDPCSTSLSRSAMRRRLGSVNSSRAPRRGALLFASVPRMERSATRPRTSSGRRRSRGGSTQRHSPSRTNTTPGRTCLL